MRLYRVIFDDKAQPHIGKEEILNALRDSVLKGVFKGNETRYNRLVRIYYEHGCIALVFDSRKTKTDGETMWHNIIDTLNETLKNLNMWQRFYPNLQGYGYFQSSIRLQPEQRR